MAGPGMNAGILRIKKKAFDEIHQEFEEKLSVFAQQVKTKMETTPAEVANKCFEIALLFLTQAFPNLEDSEQAEIESKEGKLDFDAKLKEMEAKLESKFEDHLRDIGKKQEQIEADLLKELVKFDNKLEQCDKESKKNMKEFDDKLTTCDGAIREIREDHEESKKNIKELKESTQCNKNTIAGLRKLQILFKSKLQESKTTTSPQQMPTTTTSTSSPQVSTTTTSTSASTVPSFGASAATATLSGAPLSLSQTNTFKLQVQDNQPLKIWDVKLLSSSLLLVADWVNDCVRLLDTKGQQLSTLKLQSDPWSLAILNQKSQSCWSVALALFNSSSIGLVEINDQTLSMKSVINTQQQYDKIAAVNSTTLAAGYGGVYAGIQGVDLIDLSGKILRSICSGVDPCCMVTTEDQCLIVLDGSNKIFYKFNLQQGTQDIRRDISQIGSPRSIACLPSGSFIVADSDKQVLHLVGDDGRVKGTLWNCPSVDRYDYLNYVSVMKDVCVCCTRSGSVFVFNVQGI